jgi:hypothetical protein
LLSEKVSGKFKGQRQWIREVLDKFGELQEFQTEPFKHDPDWPEWVTNLLLMLLGISHPGVKVKNVRKWKAKNLGRLLGRHYAVEHLMWGEVPLSPQVIRERDAALEWAGKQITSKSIEIKFKEFVKRFTEQTKVWRPKFQEFIQETLSETCGRPYVESSAFFEAFGKAVVMKPDDLETERTMGVGDKVCLYLFASWRLIEGFHSVGELHRHLEKVFKPYGIVLRQKRIEKLCQRIKLKFKEPGRPPGGKIQTNPVSV